MFGRGLAQNEGLRIKAILDSIYHGSSKIVFLPVPLSEEVLSSTKNH